MKIERMRWTVVFLIMLAVLWLPLMSVSAQSEGGAITVSAEELAAAITQANPGDTIIVTGGVYAGSLEIDKPLTLIGIDWPVIDGGHEDTVLKLSGAGSIIRGFVIKKQRPFSGSRKRRHRCRSAQYHS